MNEVLFFGEILLCFVSVVIAEKAFGKYGLFAWVAIASILANIQTAKQIDLFGFSVTLGTVMFASIYLATDVLVEKYTFEDSKRAVYIGLCSTVVYLISMTLCCLYNPNMFDYVSPSMSTVFSFAPRICISSVVMFFLSNLADVHLFNSFKKRDGSTKLWKRNNIATIVCNCTENFLFIFGAFLGIYTARECLIIAINTCIVEVIVALLDTPFLYLAVYNKKGEASDETNY